MAFGASRLSLWHYSTSETDFWGSITFREEMVILRLIYSLFLADLCYRMLIYQDFKTECLHLNL
jgi:hypothetical protein